MSLVEGHQATYKDVLSHTVLITALFNSEAIPKTRFARFLEKALFALVLLGLSFIAILAVFARSGIDTWIQFSLYIVPLFSMICGHLIFKSHSFKEILNRRIEQNGTNETEFGTSTVSSFLQKRSMRTCFYPVSLVVYQWAVYLMFFYDERSSEFSGPFNISQHSSSVTRFLHLDLKQRLWLPLYYTFWTIAMYVTGFVGCCFILVVEIHKLDIKSFLYNIGNGPLIHKGKSLNCHGNVHRETRITNHGVYQAVDTGVTTPVGLCFRALSLFTGFLTLGLVELVSWETHKMPGISGHDFHEVAQNVAGEISDSGVANGLTSSVAVENGQGTSSSEGRGGPPKTISPRDVSKHLVELMSSVETNSALFKPFLVLLTFFSVTNLVTHVVAMAVVKETGFTDLHWWTLARTLFWFLLAIRLLWAVATITNTLTRIIPHFYYLRSIGELTGTKEEWDNFFQLAETFRFGSRTYGFPLTLNQVASIVAVVNFSFLIALSLISKADK
jgi:hypothetical protein